MLFNHLILCHPLLWPSNFPSMKIFFNESALCTRWPKCWSFSFRSSPFNDYSQLISSRMDWFDLLAVQGSLESLLQHHNSQASILVSQNSLWSNSSICTCLLKKKNSFDYKNLFQQSNISAFEYTARFVTAFPPRSKYPLMSWWH